MLCSNTGMELWNGFCEHREEMCFGHRNTFLLYRLVTFLSMRYTNILYAYNIGHVKYVLISITAYNNSFCPEQSLMEHP